MGKLIRTPAPLPANLGIICGSLFKKYKDYGIIYKIGEL